MSHHRSRQLAAEPTMSVKSILVSVEDLIGMAMGPTDKNTVNYKMVQEVLYILARQLRMLEQQVELRADMELEPMTDKVAMKAGKRSAKPTKGGTTDRDKEKAERAEAKEREKDERARAREDEKDERRSARDKEKAEHDAEKDKAREEKDKDKAERAASKERDREEREQGKSEKEKEKSAKAEAKERERAEKDRDKADKATAKEAEKMDKATAKEREKMDKATAKEAEKMDKATAKEREKMDKATAKEREKMEKEREYADKAAAKEQKAKGKEESSKQKELRSRSPGGGSNVAITETKKGKDRVTVVEKGPTTQGESRTRVGSIEVVTRSQFDLLKNVVDQLSTKTGPLPNLVLPDNEKLRSALAKGTASLTDTMQAMQVAARVTAAEEAISRMADLLTQLAATGALPEDVASRVVIGLHDAMIAAQEGAARMQTNITSADGRPMGTHQQTTDVRSVEVHQSMTPRKSVGIDAGSQKQSSGKPGSGARASMAASKSTTGGRQAGSTPGFDGPCVSHKEMDDSLQGLRDDLSKNIQGLTAKATGNADVAANLARTVAEKLENALNLDNRISTLYSLTSDYAEQLSGFDIGLTTQMQSFQEQMAQMRTDLKGGLDVLESANNNAETAAVMELTERYEGLVTELDRTSHAHQSLTTFQKQLGDELRSLVECVEMLREQKADRDEVQDGLKDKADISRLDGLLRDEDFVESREAIEARLALCYEKFNKQDAVWMAALRDLSLVCESKAEYLQLMALRENTQDQINEMDEQLRKLADILGEPKAAMLTRKLARDATCGACMVPALMDMQERTFGEPSALPPLAPRPRPLGQEGPCLAEWISDQQDLKSHACKRWVGGSHTLMREGVTRGRAPPPVGPAAGAAAAPTRRYTGIGTDGMLYMMEEEMQPCAECNELLYEQSAEVKDAGEAPPVPETGAGDQGRRLSKLVLEDAK